MNVQARNFKKLVLISVAGAYGTADVEMLGQEIGQQCAAAADVVVAWEPSGAPQGIQDIHAAFVKLRDSFAKSKTRIVLVSSAPGSDAPTLLAALKLLDTNESAQVTQLLTRTTETELLREKLDDLGRQKAAALGLAPGASAAATAEALSRLHAHCASLKKAAAGRAAELKASPKNEAPPEVPADVAKRYARLVSEAEKL